MKIRSNYIFKKKQGHPNEAEFITELPAFYTCMFPGTGL